MRCSSASASAFPARWRNSSTSFSKRSISFWRSLSFERAGGGAAALVFSFGLIPAPFERRGGHKFHGLLPPIRACFSRAVALAARPWSRPGSTIRTRPGTIPAKRQTNLPNGREHLRSGTVFRFEREARRRRPAPPFPRADALPAVKAACPLPPPARELSREADCPASKPVRGEQSSPEKRGVPERRSYPESCRCPSARLFSNAWDAYRQSTRQR